MSFEKLWCSDHTIVSASRRWKLLKNCLLEFPNLRYNGNISWSETNSTHTVKFANSDNPSSCRNRRVVSNNLFKFSSFRYLGNRSWFGTNFTFRVKFADPVNHLLGAEMGVILCYSQFSVKQIFLDMVTGAQSNLPTPITPYQVQKWGLYLPYKPSYCRYYVKIFLFLLPWQQGLVWHKFH